MIYLLYTRDDIPQDDVHNANAHYDAIVLKNNTNTDSDASVCHATGMEEDPKVTLDIQCLRRRGGAALI